MFGVPHANDDNLLFLPLLASRSFMVAVPAIIFSLKGEHTAMSVILGSAVACGISDSLLCWKERGNWMQHAFAIPTLAVLSWLLAG